MTDSHSSVHPRKDLDCEGVGWCVYEGWRTDSGLGLAYFIRSDYGPGDRRALLASGQSIESLEASELAVLWSEATALTGTERRVIDGRGDIWLAQDVGPVWSERNTATDGVGIHLRCVSQTLPPVLLSGQVSTSLSDGDLIQALEGARA